MFDISYLEQIISNGAPELFTLEQQGIFDELVAYFESDQCAERTLYPDQVENYQLSTFSYGLAQRNAELQLGYEQTFVVFATGQNLDLKAAERGLVRLTAAHAQTQIEFNLSASTSIDVVIPAGTRVSAGSTETIFATTQTLIVAAGETSGQTLAVANIPGTASNRLPIGAVSTILDPIAYVASATNVTETGGGGDAEDDETFRSRILRFWETLSKAGSNRAYEAHVLASHPDIIDCNAVSVNSTDVSPVPDPCYIDLYVLLASGAPNIEDLAVVTEYMSSDERRAHGDKVTVYAAVAVEFTVNLIVRTQNITPDLTARINDQNDIIITLWRSQLGRNVAPSELTSAIKSLDGVEDASVDFGYIEIDGRSFANCTSINVNMVEVGQ